MPTLVETPEYQACLRFIELTTRKRALEAELNDVKKRLAIMEPPLIGYLAAANLKRLEIGDYLLYPQRDPYIKPKTGVSRQEVCDALKGSGLSYMVKETYYAQTLGAYIKQMEEHHRLIAGVDPGALEQLLPPALAAILNVTATQHLRMKTESGPDWTDSQPEGEPNE